MAVITIIDEQSSTSDFEQIKNYLGKEGIEIGVFSINDLAKSKAQKKTLSDEERLEIISSYPEVIRKYKHLHDFRADMICLYPAFEYLKLVLEKFKDIHFHFENEHWYYIDGSSGFGFLGQDGRKFIVEIFAGEYLTVPEGKWQWVIPPNNNRMKAMRFFNSSRSYLRPSRLSFS